MDIHELRNVLIQAHQLQGVDDIYTFYYDETNNIRKFHIVEDGFNVDDPGNFVLAGIVYTDRGPKPDTSELFRNLRLQKSTLELKCRHICKGDFETSIGSERLGIVLEWLIENNVYIHYLNLNVVYWALVDIVDSALVELGSKWYPFHMALKSDLYSVLMLERKAFVAAAAGYGFPNVPAERVNEFTKWLALYVSERSHVLNEFRGELLRQFMKVFVRLSSLHFLEGNDALVDSFGVFYFRNLYLFNRSIHIFDNETNIQGELTRFQLTDGGVPVTVSRFVDSKDDVFVQISDVAAGLLGKYFTFIRQSSMEELTSAKERLSPTGRISC